MTRLIGALLGLAALLTVAAPPKSFAQSTVRPCVTQSSGPCLPVSSGTPLPITGSFSASAYLPTPAYATPLSVSSSSSSVALPTGATVVLYNTGSVAAFCRLSAGAASATTSHDQVAPGGFVTYATSGYDTVSCITAASTTTVNVSGGSGTPSGSGGGGGSGGSGTSSTFGAAFPATGTAAGVSDGTNMVALRVGTAGTAASTVLTIQGVTSMTPVQVSQATASSLNATVVGSGSAGSAATGVLTVQGIASMTPVFVSSSTAPVVTMNSASANSGLNAALAGVFDDASPTAITENSFGFLRMSTNRNLYGTIRDAAGNERGANVNANSALLTAIDQTTPGTTNGVTLTGTNNISTVSTVTTLSQFAGQAICLGAGTAANCLRITQASDSPEIAALGAPADAAWSSGSGTMVSLLKNIAGGVAGSIPAGTNTIGSVSLVPKTSGGLTMYFVQPGASDNHANIKNGAGQVYHISATNNSATVNYLRLYNAATGFNGCNSATNLVGQWAIPASTSGAGIVVADFGAGIAFSTGISICVSSGYATTDTTNATASAMSVNIGYN